MEREAWAKVTAAVGVLRCNAQLKDRPRDGHLQSACDALALTLPVSSSVDDQRRMRFAIELLDTLWRCDRTAWRRAVIEALNVDVPTSIVVPPMEDQDPLAVVISIKHDKFLRQLNNKRWATLLDPSTRLTDAEAALKREVIQTYGKADKLPRAATDRIPLRLEFLVFGMATAIVEPYVSKAVSMVEAMRTCVDTSGSLDPEDNTCTPFALESLGLNVSPYEMTSGIARQIVRFHALGIQFSLIHVRIMHEPDDDDRQEDTSERDQLIMNLLRGSANVPIESLTLDRADVVQFRAACTALEATHVVERLWIQSIFTFDTGADRALKWEWLTRAIFSPTSHTSIKRFSIDQHEISLSDVEIVANTLQSIADQGGSGSHALEKLDMGIEGSDAETLQAIPRLVGLIGQNLTSLSITLWMGSLTTESLADILRACPRLQYIDLFSGDFDSMDVFLDAYENHNCVIRSLGLHSVEVPNDSITTFVQALSDPQHRISRVLRELCLDSVGQDNELTQGNMNALYALLSDAPNSPFEYLDVCIPEPQLSTNWIRFTTLHNTWGSGVAERFPIACKAAFLSVCRARGDGKKDDEPPPHPLMSKFDAHVFSLIFQLAATRSWRNVHLAAP